MKHRSTATQSSIIAVGPFREAALYVGLSNIFFMHKRFEVKINPAYFQDVADIVDAGNSTEIYDRLFKDNYCPNLFSVKYHFLDEPWVYGARVFTRTSDEHYFQIVKEYEEIPEGSFKLCSIVPTGYFSVDRISLFLRTALEIHNLYWMPRIYIPDLSYKAICEVLGEGRSQSLKFKQISVLLSDGQFAYSRDVQQLYENHQNSFELFTMDRKLYEVRIPNASYAEAWACPVLKVGDRVKWVSAMRSREDVTYTTGTVTGIAERLTVQKDDGTIGTYHFADKNIKKV